MRQRSSGTLFPRPPLPALIAAALFFAATPGWAAPVDTVPLKQPMPPHTRLAIWGDSITEGAPYPRYVEMYLLACAGRKDITVCTFGHSGETLSGLLSRQSDLDAFKPTAITINEGMNDTQYSPYTPAKGEEFDKTMRAVLTMLEARGIKDRVVVGPGIVDDTYDSKNAAQFFRGADAHGLTPAQAMDVTLGHYHEIARADALAAESAYADTYDRMRDANAAAKQALGPQFEFAARGGGIHPAANGHLMMTTEILKALRCDGAIATIDWDMPHKASASAGHSIVRADHGVLEVRSARYPFCFSYNPAAAQEPDNMAAIVPFLPFNHELNRFILKVNDLNAPSAAVTWGDETHTFTKAQLAAGVNLAAAFTHTPFDARFAHVMAAIRNKQEFENFMIKGTSNYFGNDNGGNVDENMIAVQARKDARVKSLIGPVQYAIVIVPKGSSDAVAPVIAGMPELYATVGAPVDYKMTALHHATTFSASGLPAGLSINASTGEITGTIRKEGAVSIALSASNKYGTGTGALLVVADPPAPPPPQITSPPTASAVVGAPFRYQITATQVPTNYFVTMPSDHGTEPPTSSLPAALHYDTHSGLLSGTPKTAGVYKIQVAAMNDTAVTAAFLTLTVKGP